MERKIIHDMLALGITHVEQGRKLLTELKGDFEDPVKLAEATKIALALALIIDVIHPAFDLAPSLFQDEKVHELIEIYRKLRLDHPAQAKRERTCPCVSCNEKDKKNPI